MVSQGGKTVENCDDLLQVLPSLAGTTGEFTVFPSGTGAVVVTCDFSSDSLDTVSNAFEITNSLRFNSSDDTYLSRTPSQD
ncbi:MAG: hypothetical protein H6767_03945 [Candidatus Peribacteria bacterium]|nr:MAG: hypothetical protein H6767_03945 [Candidatus Peribacteria bacterium]